MPAHDTAAAAAQSWNDVKPRIPDTVQRRRLEKQRSVREVVFGVQDGILTTLGIITGVGIAEGDRAAVLISGFALLAGALSDRAWGNSSAARPSAKSCSLPSRSKRKRWPTIPKPSSRGASRVLYAQRFYAGRSPYDCRLAPRTHPDIYLLRDGRDEFGIDPREAEDSGLRGPLAMGGIRCRRRLHSDSRVSLPVSMTTSTLLSLVCAVVGLFSVGYYAGTLSERNPVVKGLEIVVFGVAVFAIRIWPATTFRRSSDTHRSPSAARERSRKRERSRRNRRLRFFLGYCGARVPFTRPDGGLPG